VNIQEVIHQLREQSDRIQQAIDALESTKPALRGKSHSGTQPPRRRMSAAGRAKIAAAARRRWAAARKAGKRTLAKTG
jgi:hypothetical protein